MLRLLLGDELSIDIGGSLAKVVLFQPSPPPEDGQRPRLCLGSQSSSRVAAE